MKRLAAAVIIALVPSAALEAQQTAGTILRVSARVEAVCEIIASDLNLDSVAAQSASPRRGATYLRATCTPNTAYQVALAGGLSSARDMVTGVGTGTTQDHTVFGAVPATQVLPAEGYGGPVTVRIYY